MSAPKIRNPPRTPPTIPPNSPRETPLDDVADVLVGDVVRIADALAIEVVNEEVVVMLGLAADSAVVADGVKIAEVTVGFDEGTTGVNNVTLIMLEH